MSEIEPLATNLEVDPECTSGLYPSYNSKLTRTSGGHFRYDIENPDVNRQGSISVTRLSKEEVARKICVVTIRCTDVDVPEFYGNHLEEADWIAGRKLSEHVAVYTIRARSDVRLPRLIYGQASLPWYEMLATATYTQADYKKLLSLSLSLPYYPIFDGSSKRR